MKRGAGFTLVELLVAISILALVAVLGWRGLDGIVRARVALTEQMETTRGMQLAFAQLQSDVEHLATAQVLHGRAELAADSGRLTLVRETFTENEPSRLQVVAYRVRDEVLTRRESIGTRDLVQLDMLWKAATSDTDTTPAVMLQNGVAGLTVRSWESNAWRMAGTGAPQALPGTGLEVALQIQGQQVPMTKVFLLGGR